MNQLAPLRYLVALAEHRHFGRAAQACHVTQPALSNALRTLESDLGVAIVLRGRSFSGFTPEGDRLLASARRVLHEIESLRQDLRSTESRPAGGLRIGVVPTAVPVAARFAARLQALHPGIVPVVRSLSSQEIESGIDELSLDLGLGFLERLGPRHATIVPLPQYQESLYLLTRAEPRPRRAAATKPRADGAGIRVGPPVPWAQAARLPLCLLTPEMHNRTLVDAAFAEAGAQPAPAMETNSVLTLALAVRAGAVSAVLPGALVAALAGHAELQAQPLVRPDTRTAVGFMFLAGAQPSRCLRAALELAASADWHSELERNTGAMIGARTAT